MSFRARLSLFFVLIVVVPMVSLTFVLFGLIADSENGKADAGLAARQQAAIGVVGEARARAERGALAVSQDVRFATALQRGRLKVADRRAEQLLRTLSLKRIVVAPASGLPVVDAGGQTAILPARRELLDAKGRSFGVLQVSAEGPVSFTRLVKRVTGLDVVVRRDGEVLSATDEAVASASPPRKPTDVVLDGREYRAASFAAPAFTGRSVTVSLFGQRASSGEVDRSRRIAAAILLGFLVLAFAFAVLVSRSLQRQIAEFLEAARRVRRGDFSSRVPTVGQDEFAELGEEFNRMSVELEQRVADLRSERERLAGALRRIGDTFASNLDSGAVLEIVVATALDGTGAVGSRAGMRTTPNGPLEKVAEAGSTAGLETALWTAETAALAGESAEASHGSASALAHPLRTLEGESAVTGVVSVVRPDRPFTDGERELFEYLARQAAVSIENVGLHEIVERQAVTDDLTGLANRRQFQDALAREVERARR
ncbi:MAG: HAMP domain-containing protein, partial [Solirubrobacterales bacterium]|nr:HAMP domain-containing protein [Solirubrobacterales bacterium]